MRTEDDIPPIDENPWLATAEMFSDDPTLEPMLVEIYAARDAQSKKRMELM